MSTYQELKGLKVKYLSADTSGDRKVDGEVFYNSADFNLKSFISTAAWHSTANLTHGRASLAAAGTVPAGLVFGGAGVADMTEEYNGSGFSNGGGLNTARQALGGAGTQTAGLGFGGYISAYSALTEEYNGSSWTESGDLATARQYVAGAGTQTAGLAFAGRGSPGKTNSTEHYNGTSWTSGGNMNTARAYLAGCGTQTSALAFGGSSTGTTGITEAYDGTSWTEVADLNTARLSLSGAGESSTSAIAFGGSPSNKNETELWDGSSWAETANLATGRAYLAGFGTKSLAVAASGGSNSTAAEEFTTTLTATTAAAWSSGGNVNNTRRNAGCMGTQTAGLYAGGFGPPYVNYSEEYNGTSWTEGNNLTIARECSTSGFGTQTAGAVAGGGAPDNISSPYSGYSNSTDEYNGTSWSEGGDINSHRLGMATCGTQTAGFGAGGYQGANHPESPPSNTAKCEQYDGSTWTEVADLNTARSSMGHFGTQTASIACRGTSNPTESWDGSSWTNISASPIVFDGGNHGGGTQTAGVVYGPRSYNSTELWDGTTWATSVRYSTSRGGNNAGDASAGLLVGGFTGSGNSNATEEFTGETTAARAVKTIDFD
tara:strand:- start:68 stop:1873 length:1806 start_codon:yes stop_codon:yes gene_type:complete